MQLDHHTDAKHAPASSGDASKLMPAVLAQLFLIVVVVLLLLWWLWKFLLQLCIVPRPAALSRMRNRDLRLMRAKYLPRWPSLARHFDRARHHMQQMAGTPVTWVRPTSPSTHSSPELSPRRISSYRNTLPTLIALHPLLRLEKIEQESGIEGVKDLAWQIVHFCNEFFFNGELELNDIRILREAEHSGERMQAWKAEAALRYDFDYANSSSSMWIDLSWVEASKWTTCRLASVLLHELVHAWTYSVQWLSADQLADPHSEAFLVKCEWLNGRCEKYGFPFFPNVFTESWSLLSNLDLAILVENDSIARAWSEFLAKSPPYEGSLVEDLISVGADPVDAMRAKRRLNQANILQAKSVGYDCLGCWRSTAGQHLMSLQKESGHHGVFIRTDYAVAPLATLVELAGQGGSITGVELPLFGVFAPLSARSATCSEMEDTV